MDRRQDKIATEESQRTRINQSETKIQIFLLLILDSILRGHLDKNDVVTDNELRGNESDTRVYD